MLSTVGRVVKGEGEGEMEILQVLSSKSIAIALRKEMNGD